MIHEMVERFCPLCGKKFMGWDPNTFSVPTACKDCKKKHKMSEAYKRVMKVVKETLKK